MIAVGFDQRCLDQAFCAGVHVRFVGGRSRFGGFLCGNGRRQVVSLDELGFTEDGRAYDGAVQFQHIAGPVVSLVEQLESAFVN